MLKNVVLLAVCQAFMLSATSLTMTTSALVGLAIAPRTSLATLPLGLCYLTVMIALVPSSLLMQKYGRKSGFFSGALCGFFAGILAAAGIYFDQFVLFCAGAIFQGLAMSTAQFYRFAAAEVSSEHYRSRAISWVMAGGLAAAFVGPAIAVYTREWLEYPLFSISFASISVLSAGIMIVLCFIQFPEVRVDEASDPKRKLKQIAVLPGFITAVLCALVAYSAMNLLMTSTPLAMDQRGMPFSSTATIIQWHIVGMFAPSFFTGHLIHRFGVLTIMAIGVFVLGISVLCSVLGQNYGNFLIGLVSLGVGWNFLYIGGTTLLTSVYRSSEKGLVQGVNDFLVFSAVATTAMISGFMHDNLGWATLNLSVVPALVLAILSIAIFALVRSKAAVPLQI